MMKNRSAMKDKKNSSSSLPIPEVNLPIPEVDLLSSPQSLVRIPPAHDVPVSDRVRRILDSEPMRRLASISQLGMVALVYPGATHSRLEHSLGVYHNAIRLLSRFSSEGFIEQSQADAFLLAALLHDIGHWPFCHPVEDMRLNKLVDHEDRVRERIDSSSLKNLIAEDWNCEVDDVIGLLKSDFQSETGTADSAGNRFLASCLSGPIDVDKLDYLQRDSLHAGVPYGQNFDANRLIHSMCRHPEDGKLAISEKGRTAAEMMVFARYVMFSEVYWHHTVRSATAMLQRAVFLLQHRMDLDSTFRLNDPDWISLLRRMAEGSTAETMVEGLFGPTRKLYKRVAEFSSITDSSANPSNLASNIAEDDKGIDDATRIHQLLARRPYWMLVACAEKLADLASKQTGLAIHAADILIDAPPVKLEVDINVDVIGRDGIARTLGEVSPVASVLAHQQFDNHVKRVRIFVRADLRDELKSKIGLQRWSELIVDSIKQLEKEIA